jgi:hypothetical protein
MENGAFAPDGIISVQEGGDLIQEGAETIDGKLPKTHSIL